MKSLSRGWTLSGLGYFGCLDGGLTPIGLFAPGLYSGAGPGFGRLDEGLFTDGLFGAGLCTDGLFCGGLETEPPGLLPLGFSAGFAEGLFADGLLADGFLSAGLISAFGRLDEPDGLDTDDPGLPEGRPDVTFPEGLLAGRASLFVLVSDDLEVDCTGLDDDDERETDDDLEFPRDCASTSGCAAANANPINIAAIVLADNLIVLKV